MPGIEEIVISNLITNPDYMRKVLPFVKEEYFDDLSQKVVFKEVSTFIETYDNLPEPNAIALEVEKRKDLTEDAVNKVLEILSGLDKTEYNEDWLLDTTEKWCRERAIYNALMESVQIAEVRTRLVIRMPYRQLCQRHCLFVLMTMLDTIT